MNNEMFGKQVICKQYKDVQDSDHKMPDGFEQACSKDESQSVPMFACSCLLLVGSTGDGDWRTGPCVTAVID